METKIIFLIIISFLAFIFGTLPYLIKTIKGEIQPNKITWLFWSIPLFAVLAQYIEGVVTWASFPVFIAGISPFLIFCASFINPKSYWKLQKFDYFVGGGIVMFLILWGITQNVYIAIICSIIADALAAIPTLKKAYTNPETESVWIFLLSFFSTLSSFFVMEMLFL